VKATISRRQSRLREVVGRNVPMSSRLWIWGSVVSSPPSDVRDGVPVEIEFLRILSLKNPCGDKKLVLFYYFCERKSHLNLKVMH